MIGAQSGLGRLIMLASRTLDTPVVLLGTIIIGLEAFVLDRVIQAWSARVTRWAAREDRDRLTTAVKEGKDRATCEQVPIRGGGDTDDDATGRVCR